MEVEDDKVGETIVKDISSCRQQEGWGQNADNNGESDIEGDLERYLDET